jgi:hypothetical protein
MTWIEDFLNELGPVSPTPSQKDIARSLIANAKTNNFSTYFDTHSAPSLSVNNKSGGKSRSNVQKAIDLLSAPLYGATNTIVDQTNRFKKGEYFNPLTVPQDAFNGVVRGGILGNHEFKKTGADVVDVTGINKIQEVQNQGTNALLDKLGIHKKVNPRVTRAINGLGLDVTLDPLNAVSFGGASVARKGLAEAATEAPTIASDVARVPERLAIEAPTPTARFAADSSGVVGPPPGPSLGTPHTFVQDDLFGNIGDTVRPGSTTIEPSIPGRDPAIPYSPKHTAGEEPPSFKGSLFSQPNPTGGLRPNIGAIPPKVIPKVTDPPVADVVSKLIPKQTGVTPQAIRETFLGFPVFKKPIEVGTLDAEGKFVKLRKILGTQFVDDVVGGTSKFTHIRTANNKVHEVPKVLNDMINRTEKRLGAPPPVRPVEELVDSVATKASDSVETANAIIPKAGKIAPEDASYVTTAVQKRVREIDSAKVAGTNKAAYNAGKQANTLNELVKDSIEKISARGGVKFPRSAKWNGDRFNFVVQSLRATENALEARGYPAIGFIGSKGPNVRLSDVIERLGPDVLFAGKTPLPTNLLRAVSGDAKKLEELAKDFPDIANRIKAGEFSDIVTSNTARHILEQSTIANNAGDAAVASAVNQARDPAATLGDGLQALSEAPRVAEKVAKASSAATEEGVKAAGKSAKETTILIDAARPGLAAARTNAEKIYRITNAGAKLPKEELGKATIREGEAGLNGVPKSEIINDVTGDKGYNVYLNRLASAFNPAFGNKQLRPIFLQNLSLYQTRTRATAESLRNLVKTNTPAELTESFRVLQGFATPSSPKIAAAANEFRGQVELLFTRTGLTDFTTTAVARERISMEELNKALKFKGSDFKFSQVVKNPITGKNEDLGANWLNSWQYTDIKDPVKFIAQARAAVDSILAEKATWDTVAGVYGSAKPKPGYAPVYGFRFLEGVYLPKDLHSQVQVLSNAMADLKNRLLICFELLMPQFVSGSRPLQSTSRVTMCATLLVIFGYRGLPA